MEVKTAEERITLKPTVISLKFSTIFESHQEQPTYRNTLSRKLVHHSLSGVNRNHIHSKNGKRYQLPPIVSSNSGVSSSNLSSSRETLSTPSSTQSSKNNKSKELPRWRREWKVKDSVPLSQHFQVKMIRRSRLSDIHGLSKTNVESLRPLPEKAEDPVVITRPITRELSIESNESFLLEDKLSLSGSSSVNTLRSSSTFSYDTIPSERTLGNTSTGRSSVYSWGNDDEFDKQAAIQVWQMFDRIDMCLFENSKNNSELKEECVDWKSSFPYLRVTGAQVLAEKEEGTQLISTSTTTKETSDVDLLEDLDGDSSDGGSLSVFGHKVDVIDSSNTDRYSHLEEEVFAQHGDMEEFLAFDEKSIETARDCKENNLKRRAMPPITPQAFARDVALSDCFDHVWSQIVKILSDLLKLYIQSRSKNEHQDLLYGSVVDRFLESALELQGSHDPFKMAPQLHSHAKLKPDFNDLKDVMTIRSVSLKQRAPSVNTTFRVEDDNQTRLGTSSTVITQKQFSKASGIDRMMSAKTPKRTLRLQPLQPPKTAGHIENSNNNNIGEIRGTRLSSFSIPLGQQQLWGPRNGTLPPLDRLGTAEELATRTKSPKRNHRSSSAVSTQSKHSSQRERTLNHTSLPDSRPNTNHSYRSDIRTPHHYIPPPSRSRDPIHNSFPLKQIHGHTHPQTIDENSYLRLTSNLRTENHEFDDFVLWGHGPPLISPQQRRGRTAVSNTNAR